MRPAEILRDMRQRAGLTQREAAERSGIDHSQIGRYERGDLRIYTEYLERLAGVYGCRVDYVVSDDRGSRLSGMSPAQREAVGRVTHAIGDLSDEACTILAIQAEAMAASSQARRPPQNGQWSDSQRRE